MNVLLISPIPPPAGGIASWTKRYIRSKKAKENNVFVVNSSIIGKRVEVNSKRNLFVEVKRTYNILTNLKKQIKQYNIEVVHLNSPCGKFGLIRDYLCAILVKKNKIKLVTHFRCDVSYMVNGRFELFFFKKLVKITDSILTLNTVSEEFVLKNCNSKAITVPNFVSNEYSKLMSNDKEINDSINNILFAGHIQESKGCDLIYDVAKLFPNIQFTLVGYISDKFKMMDKSSNIKLLGELSGEKVQAEMLKADLLLFPTHTEGFPNVVTEAMACGMPIISTPVGAIPDMLENKGGILVPVNDIEAVVEAINTLQNRELRKQMSNWNKQKVEKSYTIDNVMNRLFEIYRGEVS